MDSMFNLLSDKLHTDYGYKMRKPILDLNPWNFDEYTTLRNVAKFVILYDKRKG